MARYGWKCNGIQSFRCILQRHFFYSTSATSTIKGSISTAPNSLSSLTTYLVGSLGFSLQQALSTSSKLMKIRHSRGATKVTGFNFSKKADLVINFLHQKGFNKLQIKRIVFYVPQILTTRIEQTLEPKMKTFKDLGLSDSEFADVISTQPAILSFGLHSTIHPALEALREVMGSNYNVARVIIKGFRFCSWTMVSKHLVSNVSLLRAQGIPLESIQKIILQKSSSFSRKTEVFKDIMIQAEKKWGVSPSSPVFLYAVRFLGCYNEKVIESKCRVFESFGWDRSHVVDLFRKNPLCFAVSEEKIKVVLSFFMTELGYDPSYIAAHPALLCYSLKKRLFPRHVVFKLLQEKGLIKENFAFYNALVVPEVEFLRKFVRPFEDDVPDLHDIYFSSIGSSAQHQSKRG